MMIDALIHWTGDTPLVLSLGPRGVLRWPGRPGQRIACQAGTLWLSAPLAAGQAAADLLLCAGQSLVLPAAADLLLSGAPVARIALAHSALLPPSPENRSCPPPPSPMLKCGSISPVPTATCP